MDNFYTIYRLRGLRSPGCDHSQARQILKGERLSVSFGDWELLSFNGTITIVVDGRSMVEGDCANMRKRTSVYLAKGMPFPTYYHLVGEVSGQSLRITRARDWMVYHFPGWNAPVAMVWDEPGHQRLFATCVTGELPNVHQAQESIEAWMDADWATHRHEYGGLVIPLVAHEKFVLVPIAGDLEEEEGPLLTIEPPCLLWHECNQQSIAAVAAIVTIRGR